jgi:hypothetical protein
MAKKCDRCFQSYPNNLSACPYCAGQPEEILDITGAEEDKPEVEEEVVVAEDEEVELTPKGKKSKKSRTRVLPDRGQEAAGARGMPTMSEGSEVDLGGGPGEGKVVLPGTSGQLGSAVNLGSLSEHRMEGAPQVILPGSSSPLLGGEVGSGPPSGVGEKPSLLSQTSKQPSAAGEKADPKATQLSPQKGQKTMLADDDMDLNIAGEKVDPKATKLAPQKGQKTMLAEAWT